MGQQYQPVPTEQPYVPQSIQQPAPPPLQQSFYYNNNNNNNNNNNFNNNFNNNNNGPVNSTTTTTTTQINFQPQQPQQQQQHYSYNFNKYQEFRVKKNIGYLDFLHGYDESYPNEIASQFSNILSESNYIQLIQSINAICKLDQENLKRNMIIFLIIFFVSFFFFPFGLVVDFILIIVVYSFISKLDSQIEVFISNYNSANNANGINVEYIKIFNKREIKISIIENHSSSYTHTITNNNNNHYPNYNNNINNNQNNQNNNLYIIPQNNNNNNNLVHINNKDDSKINLIDNN